MKPLDPRLLRRAKAARMFLAGSVLIGVLTGALIVVQAVLLAHGIAGFVLRGRVPAAVVWALVVVIVGRALLVWLQEVVAQRAAAAVKSTLRRQVLEHSLKLGPVWLSGERSSALTTLLTKGLDDLDPYFARYLPQLVLASTVPAGVIGWMATGDLLAAGTVLVTLPLIPIFMALIGWVTQAHSRSRQHALAVLAHHFADVVSGLPTLKLFGRAKSQAVAVERVTDRHRVASMGSLRLAFLSSFVLELLASISVALVAVGVGLRLVDGKLGLETALMVLILAPEINDVLPGNAHQILLAVGVVEIVAGLVVVLRPRYGGYLVAAWLGGIIVNLLLQADFYDIALRDFGLLLAALTLARLATFDRAPTARTEGQIR